MRHEPHSLATLGTYVTVKNLLIVALVGLLLFAGPVAAQADAPTGDEGGGTDGWMNILTNLYNIIYSTLQYVGLATLVLGAIIWFTARKNSQRAETGMWLVIGGVSMIVFYFGMGAIVNLLRWISGG